MTYAFLATKAPQTTQSAKQSDTSNAPASSGKGGDSSGSAAATNSPASGSKGGTKTTVKATATVFDPRLPPGGIQMISPAPTDGPAYYKVGDWVTFAWNYTSLSITPSAIDILATCTRNQATYTLALNHSATATTLLWDTSEYNASATGVQLLTETYTLMMFDANSSISATPKAGYLGLFNQFQFGMYTPQAYTPWSGKSFRTTSL
jgi:hypothetical protein